MVYSFSFGYYMSAFIGLVFLVSIHELTMPWIFLLVLVDFTLHDLLGLHSHNPTTLYREETKYVANTLNRHFRILDKHVGKVDG